MNEVAASLNMDRIELMRTFVRIVETGSLSAAARQLNTSQPTISRRLQSLERLLGLRLMQRSTHVMKLTEEGERCFAYARDLVDRWQIAETDLRGAKDKPRGLLRVLVPHAFGQDQLIAPLSSYLTLYPDVRVEWLLQDREPDFIAEGIDCAIHMGAVTDPNVIAIHMADVIRIAVAAPALLPAGWQNQASDLPSLPWLALKTFYQHEVRLTNLATGDEEQFAIEPRLSTDSLYALRNAAFHGLGAAIVSAWLVQEDLETGRLVHLAPAWRAPSLPIYMVYPYDRHYPAKLGRFIELVKATLPTLTGMAPPPKRR